MLVTRRMKRTRLSCAASSSAEAASGGGPAPSSAASALPCSWMAADQKRHFGSSRTPSPTLAHDVVMALAPHSRSCFTWASRHCTMAFTKMELKSTRVMVGLLPGAERQARNAAPMKALNEALTPASFGCAQIEVCDGEQMQ